MRRTRTVLPSLVLAALLVASPIFRDATQAQGSSEVWPTNELRAGISYALTEAMDEGHCGLPTDELIPLAEELLKAPKELILTALELESSEGAMTADKVGDTACTFLAGLYKAERAIAERLIGIPNGKLALGMDRPRGHGGDVSSRG
jgi:hypothetical protein